MFARAKAGRTGILVQQSANEGCFSAARSAIAYCATPSRKIARLIDERRFFGGTMLGAEQVMNRYTPSTVPPTTARRTCGAKTAARFTTR